MKIAIVGTGIAGNVIALHLHKHHKIKVFEANTHIGGHAQTHDIEMAGQTYAVDTGFIVFNHRTYPHFIQLLQEIGVPSQASKMSFSVKCEKSGLEYNGASLNGLFAQRQNLVNPKFYRMLWEILRFNRQAPQLLEEANSRLTLAEYLHANGYHQEFQESYLMPMGSAIWSADPEKICDFPAHYFVRFFQNHGLLSVNDQPQWRVIQGGSREYVEKMVAPFRHQIALQTPVATIERFPNHVVVQTQNGASEEFDCVFLACHSDQALALLKQPTDLETKILQAMPYQSNEVVLHTDSSLLPKRRRAWAAWNYHILQERQQKVAVTYNMNILQNLQAPVQFCVTLNNTEAIDPQKILKRLRYDHPLQTPAGVAAQERHPEINGRCRTYYCGAYWGYGFHEDGIVSALKALKHFQEREENAQLHLRWAS